MRRITLVLLIVLAAFAWPACRPEAEATSAELQPDVDAFYAEALRSEHAFELLTDLCTRAPKRLSGQPGFREAQAWAEEALLAAGADEVRLEAVEVPRWERGDYEELALVEPAELAGRALPCTALGGSVPTPARGVEGEVVSVRSFEELGELPADRLEGAIVLFARPMDRSRPTTGEAYGGAVGQRTRGASEAARYGAAAVLVRSMTTRLDDHPHTGAMRYADDAPRIPAAAVSTRAAEELETLVRSGRTVRVRLRLDCRTLDPVPAANVVGELRGREAPDEIVLVGGHLDAWDLGTGAHDDGAGCVHAIEALRLIAERDRRPRRTLRVVLFANEENGLAGGRAYRAAHGDERHVLAIESDSGGFVPRGFSTNADVDRNRAAWSRLRAAAALLERWGAGQLTPGGGGADIGPLADTGAVLCGLRTDSSRYFDIHHTALDTIDAVHPRELSLGAAALASLAWIAADSADALPANPVE